MTACRLCRSRLPAGTPAYYTLCKSCFVRQKEQEQIDLTNEVASLRAENRRLRDQKHGLDGEMVNRLIRLCHPDRHGNNRASNLVTTWLLEQRKKA